MGLLPCRGVPPPRPLKELSRPKSSVAVTLYTVQGAVQGAEGAIRELLRTIPVEPRGNYVFRTKLGIIQALVSPALVEIKAIVRLTHEKRS